MPQAHSELKKQGKQSSSSQLDAYLDSTVVWVKPVVTVLPQRSHSSVCAASLRALLWCVAPAVSLAQGMGACLCVHAAQQTQFSFYGVFFFGMCWLLLQYKCIALLIEINSVKQ